MQRIELLLFIDTQKAVTSTTPWSV